MWGASTRVSFSEDWILKCFFVETIRYSSSWERVEETFYLFNIHTLTFIYTFSINIQKKVSSRRYSKHSLRVLWKGFFILYSLINEQLYHLKTKEREEKNKFLHSSQKSLNQNFNW